MSEFIFCIGLLGAIVLVLGSAWPEGSADKPSKVKGWLFVIGASIMTMYSILGYCFKDGVIFFIFFQLFATSASILGMTKISPRTSTIITLISGAVFLAWSLILFESLVTAIFIVGLIGIALGYVQPWHTVRRSFFLAVGGAFIAIFSFIESDWIFFGLNVFFAIFSGYYMAKAMRARKA